MDNFVSRLFGAGARLRGSDAQTQDALSAQFIESVFAAIEEGVMVFSMAGELEYWNPSAERILERRFSAGRRFDEGFTLNDDGSPIAPDGTPLGRALISGRPVHRVRLGHISPAGTLRWFEVSAEPLAAVDGLPPYVVVTFSDVSEQRHAQQELLRVREQLDALAEMGGQNGGTRAAADIPLVWPSEHASGPGLQFEQRCANDTSSVNKDPVLSQDASLHGLPIAPHPLWNTSSEQASAPLAESFREDADTQDALPIVRGHDRGLAIGRLKHDRALYMRSLRLFEAELLRTDGELARLVHVREAERIGRDLRRLKGSAALLAAQGIVAAVAELELAIAAFVHPQGGAAETALEADTPLPEALLHAIGRARAVLAQHRATLLEDLRAAPNALNAGRDEPGTPPNPREEQHYKETTVSQNDKQNESILSLIAALERHDLSALDAFRTLEIPLRRILTHRQERELRMAMEVLAFERASIILREQLQVTSTAPP